MVLYRLYRKSRRAELMGEGLKRARAAARESRRPRTQHTRVTACATVARDLREFGYPDVTGPMVEEILAAWLDGKRDAELPHSVIGMFAGRQFDEIERDHPGALAAMPRS